MRSPLAGRPEPAPSEGACGHQPVVKVQAGNELRDFAGFVRNALSDTSRALAMAPTMFAMHLRARRRANLLWGLWLFLPMALTILISLSLQRQGASLPKTAIPFAAFATIGVAIWQSLAEALTMPLRLLATHRTLITRTRMPLEAPILAGLLEVLTATLLRLVCVIAILPWLGTEPGYSLTLLPFVVAGLIAMGLAIGLVAAPVGLLIEDAHRAVVIFLGVWLLMTPIAYPLGPNLTFWNPAAALVEASRASLTGGEVSARSLIFAATSLAAILPAWIWLRLSRSHLVDRVA